MTGGFEVSTSSLRSGASEAESIAAAMGDAVAAAAQGQSMSQTAFGVLCSFLVPPALIAQSAVSGALSVVTDGIGVTASAVRSSADDYDQAQEQSELGMGQLAGQVDGVHYQGISSE